MTEVFEQAARLKLRFETTKGCLSSEDVWELSLPSLDTLARTVNRRLRVAEEESFIPSTLQPKAPSHDTLRLEMLRHIISVKVLERDVARQLAEDRAKLARLKDLLAAKEDEAFKTLSQEEILKQITELEATAV